MINKVEQKIKIHKAGEKEFDLLINLINALADYEKLQRPDAAAQERLKKDLLGTSPKIDAWLVFVDNKAVGYAITCYLYSSFLALPTLYLEDIFILPDCRRLGIGKEFLKFLAKIALKENCGRMEWMVLDWNKLAIDFYKKIGAKQMKEWLPYRFTKEEIKKFVEKFS